MGKNAREREVKKKMGEIKSQAFDEMADAFSRYNKGWYDEVKEKEEKNDECDKPQ